MYGGISGSWGSGGNFAGVNGGGFKFEIRNSKGLSALAHTVRRGDTKGTNEAHLGNANQRATPQKYA
jgi:hypothetical protein